MSIFEDDTIKNLKFIRVSDNVDISSYVVAGSFSCEDVLCDKQLNFGETNSAKAEITTTVNLNLTNESIRVTYGAGALNMTVGIYHVTYSATQDNSSRVKCTMYDCVKYFDTNVAEWYESLTFPLTLKAMRDSLAQHVGVSQKTVSLVNDNIWLSKTISPSTLNGRELLQYLGQLNGVFPHSSVDGMLDWVSLGGSEYTLSQNSTYGTSAVVIKNYNTYPISKVVIRQEDGDVGVSSGSGSNVCYVTANVLVYGMSTAALQTVANNLYTKVQGHSYRPCTINAKYIPNIAPGTKVNYQDFSTYALKRNISGQLFMKFQAEGNQYLSEDTSITSEIKQLRGKSNVLTRTVEGMESTVSALDTKVNAIDNRTTTTALNNTIKQYIDSDAGTSEIVSQVSGTYYSKNYIDNALGDMNDDIEDVKDTLDTEYSTTATIESKISESESSVLLEVSGAYYNKDEADAKLALKISNTDDQTVVSLLEGYADDITFEANNTISFNANTFVLDSTYTKIDATGKITADSIDIKGGKIALVDDKVGSSSCITTATSSGQYKYYQNAQNNRFSKNYDNSSKVQSELFSSSTGLTVTKYATDGKTATNTSILDSSGLWTDGEITAQDCKIKVKHNSGITSTYGNPVLCNAGNEVKLVWAGSALQLYVDSTYIGTVVTN